MEPSIQLPKEIEEIRAFTKQMSEKEAKAEAKAKSEAWTKYAALSMALIALIAGYTMAKGGSCSGRVAKDLSEATYNQTHASDQWSFFQSKSQKSMMQELELNLLEANHSTNVERMEKLKQNIARYEVEKKEIKSKAEAYEKARDGFRADSELQAAKGARFGLAAQTFQIALAIGGLCLLSKKRWLWYITLAAGAFAVLRLIAALQG